jgi:hypothetical protein
LYTKGIGEKRKTGIMFPLRKKQTSKTLVQKQGRSLSAIVVLTVLLVLAVAVAGYFYYQSQYVVPAKSEADEVANLTKVVGSMIVLPEGEMPTLATVTDKEKLASQPFFQNAENGDKVLIYTNSGRAILYRPSTQWYKNGKIVDVTTINVNAPAPANAPADVPVDAPTPAPQSSETAAMPVPGAPSDTVEKVVMQNVPLALYNGSTKVGVTNTFEGAVTEKFSNLSVVAKDKAAKNDYQGNLVIDLSGKNAALAQNITDNFGGVVGALPDGETVPAGADILVIVGNKK